MKYHKKMKTLKFLKQDSNATSDDLAHMASKVPAMILMVGIKIEGIDKIAIVVIVAMNYK